MTYASAKALVLVATGRITDLTIGADGAVSAVVDGEHDAYEVVRRPNGVWSCTCPAWTWRLECSHQAAIQLLMRAEGAARQQAGKEQP